MEEGQVTSYKGIDVSRFQGEIDWEQVAADGVQFAFIRVGNRGYGSGKLVYDEQFEANIEGANKAGIKVGVYFFTQATTPVEAVEEASMVLMLCNQYKISFPLYIDTEGAGGNGRADGLDVEARTAVCTAFCETIENAGYTAGVYASKNWFLTRMGPIAYDKWVAQYNVTCDLEDAAFWQASSSGVLPGIAGRVDIDYQYKDLY